MAKFGNWNWQIDSGKDDENFKSLQTDGQSTEKLALDFNSGKSASHEKGNQLCLFGTYLAKIRSKTWNRLVIDTIFTFTSTDLPTFVT